MNIDVNPPTGQPPEFSNRGDAKTPLKESPVQQQPGSVSADKKSDSMREAEQIQKKVSLNLTRRNQLVEVSHQAKDFTGELNKAFDVSQTFFDQYVFFVDVLACDSQAFDTASFLAGPAHSQQGNEAIFQDLQKKITELVQALSRDRKLSVEDAYKQLIGLIDRYDEASSALHRMDPSFVPQSTFALRSALLLSAQANNANIESWMVYTKRGKPSVESGQLWNFLDRWQNWIPEAQGKYAKFIETTAVRALNTAKAQKKNQNEESVVLMKGGFGAGKTRLTTQLFDTHADGVIAPDKAKSVTRRAMPQVAHHVAHVEGSQVAYHLFNGLIRETQGTVVYDSSLNNPKDIQDCIQKVKDSERMTQANPPTLKIFDVARQDDARFLAVLRRDIGGEDPRIPPERMINAALLDKLRRHECIAVALNEKELNVEYNFLSADASGWDTQFVCTFSSGGVQMNDQYRERLSLEGLVVEGQKVSSTLKREQVLERYKETFQQTVSQINKNLSQEEREMNEAVFGKRVVISPSNDRREVTKVTEIYALLTPKVQQAIPQAKFTAIFERLSQDQQKQLLEKINQGGSISYLDLPLFVAADFHCALTRDPWL